MKSEKIRNSKYLIDNPRPALFINTLNGQVLSGLLAPAFVHHRVFPPTNLLAKGIVLHAGWLERVASEWGLMGFVVRGLHH